MGKRDIATEVASWEGVSVLPHRFGGVEFRLGRVEIGHLHGDRLADLPFPKKTRDELVESGRALPHHVLPDSGWVSRPIADEADAAKAIALFRLNYDRISSRRPGKRPESEFRL
jgi:hypothetical protein